MLPQGSTDAAASEVLEMTLNAANRGSTSAMFVMGYWLLTHEVDVKVGMAWMTRATRKGHPVAQFCLSHHDDLLQAATILSAVRLWSRYGWRVPGTYTGCVA